MIKMQMLNKTKSVCPVCLDIIDANVFIKNGKVIISKNCKKHGRFESLHLWSNPELYKRLNEIFHVVNGNPNGIMIDLTLNCNLKCPFCFTSGGELNNDFHEPNISEILEKLKKN